MEILKNICLVLLGALAAVFVFFIVVTIVGSINGLSIGEQITKWFGSIGSKTEEIADVVETVVNTSNLK